MGNMDWKDKQLEDLLREMPKINDKQNPQELYQAISLKLNKKRTFGKLIPSIASIAAVILFMFFGKNLFFLDNEIKQESSQESKMMDKNEEQQISFKDEANSNNHQEQFDTMMKTEPMKTAVYKEDLAGKEMLIYGIPDQQALNVVPVSILVNKDESINWFDQFINYMPKLTEEAWGLSEYYPLQGRLSFNDSTRTIHLDLPQDHSYGQGTANELIFQAALKTAFRERRDVDLITFSTETKPGIILGNNELEKLDLNQFREVRKPYLLLYLENKPQPMLVPAHEAVTTFGEALTLMRKDESNQGLTASIPPELQIGKVSVIKDHASVQLTNRSDVPHTREVNFAIEAILLSAKEFGYSTVEFKHDSQAGIGVFPINQPIEVPIAANKQEIK